MMIVFVATAVVVVCFLVYAYKSIVPPPPRICGSPGGSPVTSPRIKLSDGRHLSYKLMGVPKDNAKYIVLLLHGLGSSKDMYLPLSQEVMEELGVCVVKYDRAGYGESDPHPGRTVKSEAFDIQQLADQLHLGSKFYVVGSSLGVYSVWGCLKYIPHRLAGAAIVSEAINLWWRSFPPEFSRKMYKTQLKRDQVQYWITYNAPQLLYWFMTQKLFPRSGILQRHPHLYSKPDISTLQKMKQIKTINTHKIVQQGVHLSMYRDLIVQFGKWEFDPLEMENPLTEGSVCMFQGLHDMFLPIQVHRYVSKKLPWIRYYEVPNAGHLMIHETPICEAIFRRMLVGEEPDFTKLA